MSTDNTAKGIIGGLLAAATGRQDPHTPQTSGLASLWTRPEVRGLYYNGKVIQLDGYKFIGCRFDSCVLRANCDNFELVQCVLDTSTRIEYSTNLAKVVRLFLGRYEWAWNYFPAFFLPTKNADGSETVSDRGN